jgi:hypothetical protein
MRYNAVVKGGLHPNYSGNLDGIKLSWNDSNSTRAIQALSRKGSYALREFIDSFVSNVVPGANVRFRMNQISASQELGGRRAIDDVFLIDRPSTAADVLMVKAAVTEHSELTHTIEQSVNLDRNPLGTR